jgi:hypothetical protein
MLQRPEGATVEEVASAMGWQRHTVRGLFSGTLKKKLGFALQKSPRSSDRGHIFRRETDQDTAVPPVSTTVPFCSTDCVGPKRFWFVAGSLFGAGRPFSVL